MSVFIKIIAVPVAMFQAVKTTVEFHKNSKRTFQYLIASGALIEYEMRKNGRMVEGTK